MKKYILFFSLMMQLACVCIANADEVQMPADETFQKALTALMDMDAVPSFKDKDLLMIKTDPLPLKMTTGEADCGSMFGIPYLKDKRTKVAAANADGTFTEEEYIEEGRGQYRIIGTGRRYGSKYWKIQCVPIYKDQASYIINKFTINEEGGYRDKDEYTGIWNIYITSPSGQHTLKSWQNADVDLSALLHIDSYEINYDMTMEKAAEYACKNFYKVK